VAVADPRTGRASSWLDHLPAIYREGAQPGAPNFLGRFLLAFEHLLTGVGDAAEPGLEERIDRIHRVFDPKSAPPEFLDWLSGWVALTLRGDLDAVTGVEAAIAPEQRRSLARGLIASAVPLYRTRGTRRGLEALLRLFTGGLSPTITEMTGAFQVGVSRVGIDTILDGGAPHFFHVTLRLPNPDPAMRKRSEALVRAILDVEKPAHTRYTLKVETPSMQVGVRSRIGVDTLLSPPPDDEDEDEG
jgi:phage tail-like protein